MYARMIRFVLGPETRWEAERIADVMSMFLKDQPGFSGSLFLCDYGNGEYQWTSLWRDEHAATTSYEKLFPQLRLMIGDKFQWEPLIQCYNVYHPKDLSVLDRSK